MARRPAQTAVGKRFEKNARTARIARNVAGSVGVVGGAAVSGATMVGLANSGVAGPLILATNPEAAAIVGGMVAAPVIAGAAAVKLHKGAKNLATKGRAMEALVNRAQTGNTLGVTGARGAKPSNSSGDTFERHYTKGAKAGTTETVRKPRRD